MRNKFTDPTIVTRKKNTNQPEVYQSDDVQQKVEKKFARVTAHSSHFKRNFDPLSLNKRNFKK